MSAEDVWNSLCLYWLLDDIAEHEDTVLELEHQAASQARRLQKALRDRNLRMVGTGQEHWNHACDLCCWIQTLPDGSKSEFNCLVFYSDRFS